MKCAPERDKLTINQCANGEEKKKCLWKGGIGTESTAIPQQYLVLVKDCLNVALTKKFASVWPWTKFHFFFFISEARVPPVNYDLSKIYKSNNQEHLSA